MRWTLVALSAACTGEKGAAPSVPESDPVEDCDDGIDNDSDGLLDCEDGDCISSTACIEDCNDGIDNNDNGLLDCDDEDCIGDLGCNHPDGVQVSLLSGQLQIHRYADNYYWHYTSYSGAFGQTLTQLSTISSLTGIVRVLPEGVEKWSTATTSTSCAWSLDQARVQNQKQIHQWAILSGTAVQPERTGLAVEEGCRLSSAFFLPELVFMGQITSSVNAIRALYAPEANWYNSMDITSWRGERTPSVITTDMLGDQGQLHARVESHSYGFIAAPPTYWKLP